MKQLYIECHMGAAGDMLMGALYDICPDQPAFLAKMDSLGLPGVHIRANRVKKSGVTGFSMDVHVHGETETCRDLQPGHSHAHNHAHNHAHSHENEAGGSLADIRAWIARADVSAKVKADAQAVFDILAEAEAAVHGMVPENIHFHELGTLDALADILGCCLLMEMLGPCRVVCSAIHTGSGQVICRHGLLPVPAPATAHILKGMPVYSGDIKGELCTPTGAALLKYFAGDFGGMPEMVLEATGYGFGKKDFPALNCVRIMAGEAGGSVSGVAELCCNIDDMTGEALGEALEILMENGALDVFFTPIQMKKNRPAVMLTCLCPPDARDRLCTLMFTHTSTLGVRRTLCERSVLTWSVAEKQTAYGTIRVKQSAGYGVRKIKPEFDDVRRAARRAGVSFDTVYRAALRPDDA